MSSLVLQHTRTYYLVQGKSSNGAATGTECVCNVMIWNLSSYVISVCSVLLYRKSSVHTAGCRILLTYLHTVSRVNRLRSPDLRLSWKEMMTSSMVKRRWDLRIHNQLRPSTWAQGVCFLHISVGILVMWWMSTSLEPSANPVPSVMTPSALGSHLEDYGKVSSARMAIIIIFHGHCNIRYRKIVLICDL